MPISKPTNTNVPFDNRMNEWFKVRTVTAQDIPELVAVFGRAFSDYYVPMEMDEQHLRQFIELNDIVLDLSVVSEDTSGHMVGHSLSGKRGTLGWVGGAGVVPEHRRKGIGTAMVQKQVQALKASGVNEVRLEVISRNVRAMPMYEKLGFAATRNLHYFRLQRPEPEEVISLPDDLRFEPCAVAQVLEMYRPDHPWQSMKESVGRLQDARAFMSFSESNETYVEEFGLNLPDLPESNDSLRPDGPELEGYCLYRELEKGIGIIDIYSTENARALIQRLIQISNGMPIIASHVFDPAVISAYDDLGFERYIMQQEMTKDI